MLPSPDHKLSPICLQFPKVSPITKPSHRRGGGLEAIQKNTLVIGTGLAGLAFALKYAKQSPVTLISKVSLESTNTSMAQGGIAAAISGSDSPARHAEDTINAGAGLCHPDVVEAITTEAPDRIEDLIQWGLEFDKSDKDLISLGKEGGHSERRIVHISDHTGQSLHAHLLNMAKQHPNIELIDNHFAVDLITEESFIGQKRCLGAIVLDQNSKKLKTFSSHQVVLSTGGAGKIYLYTSNWEGATGDGIAMAYRAGARLANLEFMQFHPTCLYHPHARNFLISEALRGEGGTLINKNGDEFVKRAHPSGSLAPRDIVARAIDSELKLSGDDCVFLDMTHHSEDFLENRFHLIFNRCRELGIDISKNPIPVVPAAHYLCGGVVTDLTGQTSIHGLYALGETACTGLHGANRLASNSLLECLVTASNCAQRMEPSDHSSLRLPAQSLLEREPSDHSEDELVVINHMWNEVRRLMWNYVGIVRSNRRLERAAHRLKTILKEIEYDYSDFAPNSDVEELRNLAQVASLTVQCAMGRKESRGVHYSLDYPNPLEITKQDTLIN